jgi:hypothetical protein
MRHALHRQSDQILALRAENEQLRILIDQLLTERISFVVRCSVFARYIQQQRER